MPASDRLVAVAAHGLAGSRTDPPAEPLSEIEWFDLVQGCVASELIGFLSAAAGDGHLAVSPGQADELAVLAAEHAGLSGVVEQQAVTVASVLRASGIEHRIVDGPARRLVFDDLAARPARTARVLVAPPDLAEAHHLVGAPQAPPGAPVARPRVEVVATIPGLDRTSRTDLPALLGGPATVALDGRTVDVLTIEQQLVVACAEITATPVPSLAALRDVAQLALAPALELAATRRQAEVAGVSDALADGVSLAWTWFDLADKTGLSVWALRRARPAAERRAGHLTTASPARVGLAQRVLGRRTSAPSAPAGPPPAAPALAVGHLADVPRPDGRGRSHRPTRRSR